MKNIVYLAGLPRSGSTLIANVLAMHPEISSTPSSPLCSIVQGMRRQWSDDPFLLSQLDSNFDAVHERLKRSMGAFIQEWSAEHPTPIVVDKNRGWLNCAEWLRELDPDFKMIVTLRDLRDVYTSVEKQHRKTLFIDFPDHMEHNFVDSRANGLLGDEGIVGSILKGIQNISDIPNISEHIYYWRFEDFISAPQETTGHLFDFLGVDKAEIDLDNIVQSTHESDSYYRMKYSHKINSSIVKPQGHTEIPISPRIIKEIETRFQWYFEQFYPEAIQFAESGTPQPPPVQAVLQDAQEAQDDQNTHNDDTAMIRKLEESIKAETE